MAKEKNLMEKLSAELSIKSKNAVGGLVKKLGKNAVPLAAAAVITLASAVKSWADTYYVSPGEHYAITQAAIDNPIYDSIEWLKGEHEPFDWPDDCYWLAPDKSYIIDANATISGSGTNHWSIFQIANKGNINITGAGETSILQNARVGIGIGNSSSYNNINIIGMNFNNLKFHIHLNNIENGSVYTKAAVDVNECFFNNGDIGINYYTSIGQFPTQYSPYAAAYNNSAISLKKYLLYTPKALITIVGHAEEEIVVLGQNEVSNNYLENCDSLTPTDCYDHFNSPTNNAYFDVNEPYYGDPNNGNRDVDANDFLPNTKIPKRNGELNNRDGTYTGPIPPLRLYKGNINYDDYVNIEDLKLFTKTWLDKGLGDLNNNGITNNIDYSILAVDWGKQEPPEPNE